MSFPGAGVWKGQCSVTFIEGHQSDNKIGKYPFVRRPRRLACSEHVDELHTEPAWCDMRDGPDVACAWHRQVGPRVFGRSSMLPSPEPPPGVATAARAFVSPSTHAMSTHTPLRLL